MLTACIYGVDLDPIAVQVAQMSLCLKVLEDETQEALAREKSLFPKETYLPDLDQNVVHANSLVPLSAYPDLISDEYLARSNAVDWAALMARTSRRSGFDAVVGNPPWGAELDEGAARVVRKLHQPVIVRMPDTYIYFAHLSIDSLLRPGGRFGMVLPGTLLNQTDAAALRRYLVDHGVDAVANLGEAVFGDATNTTCLIVATKGGKHSDQILVNDVRDVQAEAREIAITRWTSIDRAEWETAVRSDKSTTFFTRDFGRVAAMHYARTALGTLADAIDDLGIQRGSPRMS
ncbi:MAG: N-6 DNA methylase [Rhodospirillales bacterium]|nr:N-6 DNA methylase [Rhodospirillales bacterium]